MILAALSIVLLALVAAWWFVRRRQAAKAVDAKPASKSDSSNSAYHAVSIQFQSNACAAAREMEGRRFLSSAAPRLPLPECQSLECSCRFIHHDDRREAGDRRSPFGHSGFGLSTGQYEKELRQGKDRRSRTDADDSDFY